MPPTWARSVRRRSCSQRMLALKAGTPGSEAGGNAAGAGGAGTKRGILQARCVRASPHDIDDAMTRPVFYVSDGTGITAETIGHSLLTQFAGIALRHRPHLLRRQRRARRGRPPTRSARPASAHGVRPIVVNSCVDSELSALLAESGALMLDVFAPFIEPLERELGRARASRGWARRTAWSNFEAYHRRINAMNYALTHDDGIDHGLRRCRPDPRRRVARGQDADLRVPGAALRHPRGQLSADRGRPRSRPPAAEACARIATSCSG